MPCLLSLPLSQRQSKIFISSISRALLYQFRTTCCLASLMETFVCSKPASIIGAKRNFHQFYRQSTSHGATRTRGKARLPTNCRHGSPRRNQPAQPPATKCPEHPRFCPLTRAVIAVPASRGTLVHTRYCNHSAGERSRLWSSSDLWIYQGFRNKYCMKHVLQVSICS